MQAKYVRTSRWPGRILAVALLILQLALPMTAAAVGADDGWQYADLSDHIFQAGGLDFTPSIPGALQSLAYDGAAQDIYDRFLENFRNYLWMDPRFSPDGEPSCLIDFSDLELQFGYVSDMDTPGTDMYLLHEVFCRVLNEHCELFFVNSGIEWRRSSENSGYLGLVRVYYDPAFTMEDVEVFEDEVDDLVAALRLEDSRLTPLDKLIAIHDYLIDTVTYNEYVSAGYPQYAPDHVYNAWGALMCGDAVCEGYACAFQLLAARAGLPSTLLPAYTMNHGWNMVQLDGEWYHIDVTWDDSDRAGFGSYTYFLRSTAWMQAGPDGVEGDHSSYTQEEFDALTPEQQDAYWNGRDDHYGWAFAPKGDGDEDYASGWAFNGQNHHVHRAADGQYYYLLRSDNDMALHKGPLRLADGPAQLVDTLKMTPLCGVQWDEGFLYYSKCLTMDPDNDWETCQLTRYDLASGKSLMMREFGFPRDWETDSYGIYTNERIEMVYDGKHMDLWLFTASNQWLGGTALFTDAWQDDSKTHTAEIIRAYDYAPEGEEDRLVRYACVYLKDPDVTDVVLIEAIYRDKAMVTLSDAVFYDAPQGCLFFTLPDLSLQPGEYTRKLFILRFDGSCRALADVYEETFTVRE